MAMRNMAEYTGHPDQLLSVRRGVFSDGAAEGVPFIDIDNGSGLSATVLPGRCLDLYQVRFLGRSMNYISPAGIRNAAYYDASEDHWLRDFYVGQMTTVGLQNIGPARPVYGETQGLHGRIGMTPAENTSVVRGEKNGIPFAAVSGTMREGRLFGENLLLLRKMLFEYGKNAIRIRDTVVNRGYEDRQFALLYHINFGYPLLSEDTEIRLDTEKVTPRTEEAEKHLGTWNRVLRPSVPFPERCYFHEIRQDRKGMCAYEVVNAKLGAGVRVRYNGQALPFFCEWQMFGKGEYVLGLEPSNLFMDGPAPGEKGCAAPVLGPGESAEYELMFEYFRA